MSEWASDNTVCRTLVVSQIGSLLFIVSIIADTTPLVNHERNNPTDIAAVMTPEGHKVGGTI